ncbi:hypothetical protein AOZ06_17520 [Kibdelosporangium phytohabitans]|uniref:Uncharacterized protein n=1 Tax=Kibdelosporangium phytohabitans TaxID=860235 RepID=A0A0N9HNF7_9PSEU|nr:hypothetical protein AOZ06_17520 [Kibdelosporangium phytohabitans]
MFVGKRAHSVIDRVPGFVEHHDIAALDRLTGRDNGSDDQRGGGHGRAEERETMRGHGRFPSRIRSG